MCDCIKINYTPIGQEPVSIEVTATGVLNGKNYYEFIAPVQSSGCDTIKITYQLIGEEPVTVEVESSEIVDGKNFYIIEIDGENYPLRWYLSDNWWYLDASTGLILSEDTPCPFGVYTIEEGNIFESFVVEPVTEQTLTIA
jgi:hypothetical protein